MPFRVGITRDFLNAKGEVCFGDIGLGRLDQAGLQRDFLPEYSSELRAEQIADYDALLLLAPRATAAALAGASRLKLIARFGVGYDNVDVAACTANDVLLTITPDGVRRPVAQAALTLVLALAGKLLIKDRLTRAGRWDDKLDHLGLGVAGRTLGIIGLGNIGREIFRVAAPLEMKHVGHDPFVTPEAARAAGIEWLPLDDLLGSADFVVVCCALTRETHHLLGPRQIALLKREAYLINVARGPIVDQAALTAALTAGAIGGAGLDVFEREPIDSTDPLLKLDNVIVTPHALCWTDECFAGNGRSACDSIIDVAAGRMPQHVVNRDVLLRPGMMSKLQQQSQQATQ